MQDWSVLSNGPSSIWLCHSATYMATATSTTYTQEMTSVDTRWTKILYKTVNSVQKLVLKHLQMSTSVKL